MVRNPLIAGKEKSWLPILKNAGGRMSTADPIQATMDQFGELLNELEKTLNLKT
jgi:hypothetical protein